MIEKTEKMPRAKAERHNGKKIAKYTLIYTVFVLIAIFLLFPFFVMLMRSFMTDLEVTSMPKLLPENIQFEAYQRALSGNLIRSFGITLIVIAINVVAIPLSAAICAYGFAKLHFKGRKAFFSIALSTMMLPSVAMQIPLYVMYLNLNWVDTLWPMIVPGFFGGGIVNIFLLRQFMKGVPNDISEAAGIDGANRLVVFFRIMLPLCKPIIIYLVVNTFLGVWNDFMTPMTYLRNAPELYTLSMELYTEFTFRGSDPSLSFTNVQMAAGVMMLLPCMVIFFIFQKQLISGIVMGGIKG